MTGIRSPPSETTLHSTPSQAHKTAPYYRLLNRRSILLDTIAASIQLDEATFNTALQTGKSLSKDPISGWRYRYQLDRDDSGDRHYHTLASPKVTLRFSEQGHVVRLREMSLPSLLNGHNGHLLSPEALNWAADVLDHIFAPFHLPAIRGWRLRRVDFAHDFSVDPAHVDNYLSALAKRELRQPGWPAAVRRFEPGTVVWFWRKRVRQISVYDKRRQMAGRLRVPEGILRFEVRYLKGEACTALARELLDSELRGVSPHLSEYCLPLEAALDPRVAHRFLSRYHRRLGLDAEIGCDDALRRLSAVCRTPAKAALLHSVYLLQQQGLSREQMAARLSGYANPSHEVGKLLRELRDLGLHPGPALPGLHLPDLAEYAGEQLWSA